MNIYSADNIKTVSVCGAGTMGAGIAYLFAKAGFITVLYDVSDPQLNKAENTIRNLLTGLAEKGKIEDAEIGAIMSRVGYTTDIYSLEVDLVIEAIIENAEAKTDLFLKLASINPHTTIFATNTSSIPVTRIASSVPHPERIAGMHFFNPAPVMKLVEVVSGAATADAVAQTIFDLSMRLGKTPVYVKDSPGFIVNRIARHFYVESLKILEEQIAPVEMIDELMEASGFKMGPFKLMDLIGVDTNFYVTQSMYESFHHEPRFRPSRIQQQKVDAGHHGKKSGQGFYKY
jgi:3-hydroxybutyryl-CoA dehydrogenase